jgi:2-amino-4-hydroxy-6-hydroxymethyldihydropteridine diphosphokinase
LSDSIPKQGHLHQACLLIGSNINPIENIRLAIQLFKNLISIKKISSVYETKAIGSEGPNFLNFALWIETYHSREELVKEVLAPVEEALGRIRTSDKNAPRTVDVDVLIYDGSVLDPNMWTYPHVAIPVSEVIPVTFSEAEIDSIKTTAKKFLESGQAKLRNDIDVVCWSTNN